MTYHLGQFHRATAMMGTAWFVVAIAVAAVSDDRVGRAVGPVVVAILATMMWTARNAVRHSRHNRFEAIHRYGGWTALALLVTLVVRRVAVSLPPGAGVTDVVQSPSVLLLVMLVALVVHPWLGVKRLPCEVTGVTDDVVVLALPGKRSLGEYVRVSREGKEWHAFAVAVNRKRRPGSLQPRHPAGRRLDGEAGPRRGVRSASHPPVRATDARLRVHVSRPDL